MVLSNDLSPLKSKPMAAIGPDLFTIFRNWTRLTTDSFGNCRGRDQEGLHCANTLLISHMQLLVNGKPLQRLFAAQTSATQWNAVAAIPGSNEQGNLPKGHLPRCSTEVCLGRTVERGLTERIVLRNHDCERESHVKLQLELAAPIADAMLDSELKKERSWHDSLKPRKMKRSQTHFELIFTKRFGRAKRVPRNLVLKSRLHEGSPIERGFTLTAIVTKGRTYVRRMTVTSRHKTSLSIEVTIPPLHEFELTNYYDILVDGYRLPAPRASHKTLESAIASAQSLKIPQFHSSNPHLDLMVAQALIDLESLRLSLPWKRFGLADGITAGIPRYIGVFGRDTLISGWQSAMFEPERLQRDITRLSGLQGRRFRPECEEEPGRFFHEQRLNPESLIGHMNRALYYGDVTSTPFYAIALSSYLRWTGDRRFLQRHEHSLRRSCEWILSKLDRGNGFIYYDPPQTGRRDTVRNQAWKDSGDAIVDERGRICVPPLALCEIQGYAHRALREAATVLKNIRGFHEGDRYLAAAEKLKTDFNTYFWMPKEKMFGLALQGKHGDPIRAIASNAGHCLSTEIIDKKYIAPVVECMMSRHMFSGWGIRTLSSANPAYDPFSYHRGSVWPVENAEIANGMALCGFHKEANQVAQSQLNLAMFFPDFRLPEVVTGHAASEASTPGLYPYANLLQAWSASAVCQMVQTLLGIYARADEHRLMIDPRLPEWLERVTLQNINFADGTVDLEFERKSETKTEVRVLKKKGRFKVDVR